MLRLFSVRFVSALLAAASILSAQPETPANEAIKVFRTGDYKSAIPLLKAPCPLDQEAVTRAALLSALVYEGQVDEAADLADALALKFPSSPEVMTAHAELLFYAGDILAADKLFRAALQAKPDLARAHLGQYRVLRAASYFRSAKMSCLRAHAADPDDALITLAFMRYLVPKKLREELPPFMEAHPWFAQGYEQNEQTSEDLHKELAERKPFEMEGPRQETELHLIDLLEGPKRIRGFGLEMTVEGGRPLRLLLDTGATGILISQRAVDKAGLKHIGSGEAFGVGDGGARKTFATFAQTCSIAKMSFKNCVFGSTEGKGRIGGDEDGLIGTDFFAAYLIHLDFQRHEMKLKPLPERPPNAQGYDRTVLPEETGFTPLFRFGHRLMIPTKVNGSSSGLFLLDTGAQISVIDSDFARLSTKVYGDEHMRVGGLSGSVKEVFEAGKAELEFGHFRQRNLGLTAINLNNAPRHQDVRMSGILGLPVLALFRLDLDYRNGLVKFDYILKGN